MPVRETIERAPEDGREGKSPSTQAGEFVREEMHPIHEDEDGVRSPRQAIAIDLSKARHAVVKLDTPRDSASSRRQSAKDSVASEPRDQRTSTRRPVISQRKRKKNSPQRGLHT
jgi:hypothetical protein